jgi:hypothetical protein
MSKSGRPKVTDKPDVVSLLMASFQNGLTVRQACIQSGISHEAYYRRLREDSEFADKMYFAQQSVVMQAKKNVIQAIKKGDIKTSIWLLNKVRPEVETSPETQQSERSRPKTLLEHMKELQQIEEQVITHSPLTQPNKSHNQKK